MKLWTSEEELVDTVMDGQNISNTTDTRIDPPRRLSGKLKQHTLEAIIGKKKFPTKNVKSICPMEKRAKQDILVNYAKYRRTKENASVNIIF